MNRVRHFSLAILVGIIMCCSDAAHGQRQPTIKITILEPTNGAELKKTAKVRVRITLLEGGKHPSFVHVSIGGPPWVRMEQADETGQWTGQMDTSMVPNGSHRLTVISDERRARARIRVNVQNWLRFFFAGLRSHTSYSDGTLTPAIAHEYARDVAKLDVFCLTDHLEPVDETEWLDMREQAWDFNENGRFVVIPGLEWTKKWGHVNLFDPKTRHWPEDPAEFYKAIAAADVVAKFNHPGDGTESHGALEYSEVGDKAIQMMEVRREKEEKAFIRALNNGWHLAPDGSDDTHSPNWGNAGRWTGILAPGLSKRCIWDALKNRRVYSTLDRNCRLRFRVNGAEMGSIIIDDILSGLIPTELPGDNGWHPVNPASEDSMDPHGLPAFTDDAGFSTVATQQEFYGLLNDFPELNRQK